MYIISSVNNLIEYIIHNLNRLISNLFLLDSISDGNDVSCQIMNRLFMLRSKKI